MAKMFLMCGLSGAGKTCFAKQFSERNRLILLSLDYYEGDQCEKTISLYRDIKKLEKENRDCIVDVRAISEVERRQFLNFFPNFEHHLVYIACTLRQSVTNLCLREEKISIKELANDLVFLQPPSPSEDRRWKTITQYINIHNKLCFSGMWVNTLEEEEEKEIDLPKLSEYDSDERSEGDQGLGE